MKGGKKIKMDICTQTNEKIEEYFAKASKKYLPSDKRYMEGIKIFKRKVLGLCGKETTKSLEELTTVLKEMDIVNSISKGKKFIASLYGKELIYINRFDKGKWITLTPLRNELNKEMIKIKAFSEEAEWYE